MLARGWEETAQLLAADTSVPQSPEPDRRLTAARCGPAAGGDGRPGQPYAAHPGAAAGEGGWKWDGRGGVTGEFERNAS